MDRCLGSLTEAALVRAWQAAAAAGRPLRTREGEAVEVLFAGRPNHGPGPDFRGALFRTRPDAGAARYVRGDVELHLAASGWREHGHGDDPAYDRVVVHVVARDDGAGPTVLHNGLRVPVLELPPGTLPPSRGPVCCGAWPESQRARAPAVLETQGLLRFTLRLRRWRIRVHAARGDLAALDAALFRAVIESLGYGGARRAFRRLAVAMPWTLLCDALPATPARDSGARCSTLASRASGIARRSPAAALPPAAVTGGRAGGSIEPCPGAAPVPDRAAVHAADASLRAQALLLGAAGLLAGDPPPGMQFDRWRALQHGWAEAAAAPALLPGAWQGRRYRPGTGPVYRLLAAGVLAARWAPGGPLRSLLGCIDAAGGRVTPALLRRWLRVEPGEAGLERGRAPLGSARAGVIAVNVLLPLLAACARSRRDAPLLAAAREAYRLHPALEPDAVVRPMAESLGLNPARLTACQQQGLHHVFARHCRLARRSGCPLRVGSEEMRK